MEVKLSERVRFGEFVFDLKAGELCQGAYRVVLQEQPFQILRMLVERRGQVVTRDEIKKQLWPNDTIVEFDHSIQAAISKLRQSLGDSAGQPRYIETLARRGYRLMVKVESLSGNSSDSSPSLESPPSDPGSAFAVAGPAANLIGKKVSHYRVLEVVGGGGMGVVYKAEDLKLGRRVALKFLPEELGDDAKARERFEREARAASALDHPNICAIHEFGEHNRQPFIVMPLLQGQNLRDLISARGAPFSSEEILGIGIQIASGLEAAHEKGIIHRDIKPANIFITTGGPAKILDFGLAKLVEAEEHNEDQIGAVSVVPPFSPARDLTITGLMMGTAGYMSPEQVRGEKLDARTDLFSFGLVLYEMGTGQRAFAGQTAAAVKDAIQNEDPTPLRHINPVLPEKLESIVNQAIEKDRERRYQCASDIRLALERTTEPRRAQRGWIRGRRILVSGLAMCFLAIAAALLFRRSEHTDDPSALVVRKLSANSPENPVFDASLSPDGSHLVYRTKDGISVLQVDTGDVRPLSNSAGYDIGNWVDGDHVEVAKHGQTWEMSIFDGAVQKIQSGIDVFGIDGFIPASPDGRLRAVPGPGGISVLDATGSKRYFVPVESEWSVGEVQWSPSGTRLLYLRYKLNPKSKNGFDVELETCDLGGSHRATILSDPFLDGRLGFSGLEWLPDGRVIFTLTESIPTDSDDMNLWSLRVDVNSGLPRGKPQRLTSWSGFSGYTTSSSRDGKRLAVVRSRVAELIKVGEIEDNGDVKGARRLSNEDWPSFLGAWTPDGQALFVTENRYGTKGIFKQSTTGQAPTLIAAGAWGPVVTPDATSLLYTQYADDGRTELMRIPLSGGMSSYIMGDINSLSVKRASYECSKNPTGRCVILEKSGEKVIFSWLDPSKGRSGEILAIHKEPSNLKDWVLSPDSRKIAWVEDNGRKEIHIFDIDARAEASFALPEWDAIQVMNWSSVGNQIYFSGAEKDTVGTAIARTDLAGRVKVLIRVPNDTGWLVDPIPSPDGHYLAYEEKDSQKDVVLLEKF